MDTAPLESVYRRILDLAQTGEFAPGDDAWTPEMVLAHLTVNDELLIAAVRGVLSGSIQPYDNRAAVDDEALAAAGSWPELIDRLQTSSRQLLDLASQLTDGLEDTEIPARIEDDGEVAVDGPVPVRRLLATHAERHLPSHLSQLEQLRTGGRS